MNVMRTKRPLYYWRGFLFLGGVWSCVGTMTGEQHPQIHTASLAVMPFCAHFKYTLESVVI